MKTVANTKLKSSSAAVNGRVTDVFEPTPIMSTYLLAFIVSKYDSLNNTDAVNPFGVYARPEAKPYLNLSLEFGVDMLNEFKNYLGIDYYASMDKMDMAAIPDFSAGGKKFDIFLLLSLSN